MNLMENLGIQTKIVSAQRVVLTVKVTDKLKQPFGIVHGGVNATLAETAASLGANQWLKEHYSGQVAIGLNVNTQHLAAVRMGEIKTVATPVKCGRRIQTWTSKTYMGEKLTSSSLVTLVNQQFRG